MPFCGRQKRIGHTQASRRKRRGAGEDPKQATGVASSLEGSQTRRGAEAVPHTRRLKHRAATGNISSPMPTTLTVSSARNFLGAHSCKEHRASVNQNDFVSGVSVSSSMPTVTSGNGGRRGAAAFAAATRRRWRTGTGGDTIGSGPLVTVPARLGKTCSCPRVGVRQIANLR